MPLTLPLRNRFKNKSVFITGASSGIGAGLAREFAHQGASVAVTGRRLDNLKKLQEEIQSQGGRSVSLACDVTRDGELERALSEASKQFGPMDVVVANAGFGVIGNLEKLTVEDYRRQFETNVFGVLRTVYASLEHLRSTRGTLVIIGSISGYISLPGSSPYGMSKFAVRALADSLRFELKKYGISVVLISPGFVQSEIHRVDNLGKFHSESPEQTPAWIKMPTAKAARQIVQATYFKRAEKVVTFHGKAAVWVKRFTPWLFDLIIASGLRPRKVAKRS